MTEPVKYFYMMVGQTESGDFVGPYIWDHSPTEEEQIKVLRRDFVEEYECFGGDYGGISTAIYINTLEE